MINEWIKELETGIHEIDEQHKELINRLSNLIGVCSSCLVKEEIMDVIAQFKDYIEICLETEEKYMKYYNYCDFESHNAIHSVFRIVFYEMREKYTNNKSSKKSINQTCGVLINWIIWHINNEDRKLAQFLSAKAGTINSKEF